MTLETDKLVDHLQKIRVAGEIPATVFQPDLSTSAINTNGSLVVDAPKLVVPGELWEETRAVVGLQTWIGDLKNLSADEPDRLEYQEGTVFISSGSAGEISLTTADPAQDFTQINDPVQQNCEAVLEANRSGGAVLMPEDHKALRRAEGRYGSKLLHGRSVDNHTEFRVGPDLTDGAGTRHGSWRVADLNGAPPNFRLNLQHLTAVLKQCVPKSTTLRFVNEGQWLMVVTEASARVYSYGLKVIGGGR